MSMTKAGMARSKLLIAFLTGCTFPLAFAPYALYPIAWLPLAILWLLWEGEKPRSAARQGFFWGTGVSYYNGNARTT